MALPRFSWDIIPRFIHCGPTVKQFPDLPDLYRQLAAYPMVTLEKFTLQDVPPVSLHEEAKIVEAARAIKAIDNGTKVIFYHMAWQNFEQFDLYNETKAHQYWSVVGDDGRPVCAKPPCSYNMTNPAMRAAWVATLKTAMDSGVIDGFFIDITPQALPNTDNTTYASNIEQICPAARCSPERQQGLLDSLRLAFDELAAAVGPEAIIICNPADFETCNVEFFEFFGTSVDHGRSVVDDFARLQSKWPEQHHLVQARAAGHNDSAVFHAAEFLIGAGKHTYFGLSGGWGCGAGWLDDVPSDPGFWDRPLGPPLGPATSKPNGAGPAAAGLVYEREFGAGTRLWVNLTTGWKHARECIRPANQTYPAVCPQVCIRWSDGHESVFPPTFTCPQQPISIK